MRQHEDVNMSEITAERVADFHANLARESARVREEQKSPFWVHRWVRLENLKTAALNGKIGEIVLAPNAEGRLAVRVEGEAAAPKLIKQQNLAPLSDDETAPAVRLAARGEKSITGGFVTPTRCPTSLLQSSQWAESPVSALLGFPLRVTRVTPREKLGRGAALDNQWVTWMMIKPSDGFAPPPWQQGIGPVVVWRPGHEALSQDDMALFNDFLSDLLDRYSDGAVDPRRDLTPQAWAARKREILEHRRAHEGVMVMYKDLNI